MASPELTPSDREKARRDATIRVLFVALVVVLVAVLVYLDRRVLLAERDLLLSEVETLGTRLEAATDVLGLRVELQEQAREIESLRRSLGAAEQAIEVFREESLRYRFLELLPQEEESRGWLLLERKGGRGIVFVDGLKSLPPNQEYLLSGSFGGQEKEMTRLRPGRDGRAMASFEVEAEGDALGWAWIKVARLNSPGSGSPVLMTRTHRGP